MSGKSRNPSYRDVYRVVLGATYHFGPYDRPATITAKEPSGLVQQRAYLPARSTYQFFGDPDLKISVRWAPRRRTKEAKP